MGAILIRQNLCLLAGSNVRKREEVWASSAVERGEACGPGLSFWGPPIGALLCRLVQGGAGLREPHPSLWSQLFSFKCHAYLSIFNHRGLLLFSRSVLSDSLRPVDCSTPGFSVLHHLPELAQTHVHWVGEAGTCLISFFKY